MKVLITGSNGFLGRNVQDVIADDKCMLILQYHKTKPIKAPDNAILTQCNLTDEEAVYTMFQKYKPDVVIHLACVVNGIKYNLKHRLSVFSTITDIDDNVIGAAAIHGVKNFIYPGSLSCYPYKGPYSLKEEDYTAGEPESWIYPYAAAKRIGLTRLKIYAEEYGLQTHHPIFPNIFGFYDKFEWENARVVPAFIRRINEGQEITLLGDGTAKRDFMFARTAADHLWDLVYEKPYIKPTPINVSFGHGIQIGDIPYMLGYEGRIKQDLSFNDPTPVLVLDNTKIKSTDKVKRYDVSYEDYKGIFGHWLEQIKWWFKHESGYFKTTS